jgi:hypothetical protein
MSGVALLIVSPPGAAGGTSSTSVVADITMLKGPKTFGVPGREATACTSYVVFGRSPAITHGELEQAADGALPQLIGATA